MQLVTMVLAGVVAGGLFAVFTSPAYAPLIGWDVAATLYLIRTWYTIWPMSSAQTARLALREDASRPLRDVLLLSACLTSLVAIGYVLGTAGEIRGYARALHIVLGIASVLLSWGVVHTVFTTRYARLYYTGIDGGINFNQKTPPCYSDFAYVAFTIGLTFQVSDTNITHHDVRATALRHALLSYLFGAVIIAATINLLAGLVR
ncbi:DUF1345 domain-containing protein [Micromonospora zhanjiangensis]